MSNDHQDECTWGSRRLYLMVLLCQTIGTSIFTSQPNAATSQGATGYIIGFVLTFILIGIPLLYMEFIISQFTGRNCIDVWKTRACLSHIGYVQITWQMFFVIYNHLVTAFVIHYFLISFEDPIPYYVCGKWSTPNCNIETNNFTVNEDCVKSPVPLYNYCDNLHATYPEYQYWRNYILGVREGYYYVAWRICLASAIACAILFLSCFKRRTSIKWFLFFFTLYPIVGYFLLLIGSMMQKGLVENFEEALDTNFKVFMQKYRVSDIILQALYTLNIGSGISFNLGASTSFRAPCYSNIVITVVVCVTFMVLVTSTITIMTCPYAYEYNTRATSFMNLKITLIFEKLPRLLKEFDHKSFWLILCFSSNAILGLSTTIVIILSLLETFASKSAVIDKYTGLVTFAVVVLIFLITTPFLGSKGVHMIFEFRRAVNFINVFIGMIESLVFVVWYGLDKFSEDVHFMQGIQPKSLMKLAWVSSSLVLAYVFFNECYVASRTPVSGGELFGRWALAATVLFIIGLTLVKLIVAACKKKFIEAIKMDPMWGPSSELLLRSRAMFSAQAMTKEYMYRQYHLQAGILTRQKASNIRREQNV